MISGSATLDRLLAAIAQEQARLGDVDASLNRSNDELLALDAKRVADLKRLAALRLDYLANRGAGRAGAPADAGDEQVLKFVAQRDAAFAALKRRQEEQAAKAAELEAERARAATRLAEAADALDAGESATQERLKGDAAYQHKLEAARAADRVAEQAEAKAAQSEAELEAKGEAYRADRLFAYLWRRHYGTPEYRAGGLFLAPLLRYLDGRVARIVGYLEARANYARLLEIPARLREHAERAKSAADAAHAELEEFDKRARADDGIDALAERVAAARGEVEGAEARIAAAAEAAAELRQSLERFGAGEDPDYLNAVEYLQREFDRSPLEVLRARALTTPSPDDDLVVSRLADLSRRRDELAAAVEELRAAAGANRRRLQELTQLRADFGRAGMALPGSAFRDERAVSTGFAQYLAGMITAQALWQLLSRQRTRTGGSADPGFGSGGFGRGTVWGGGQGPAVDAGRVLDTVGSILEAVARSSGGHSGGGSSGGWSTGASKSGGGSRPSGGSRSSGGFKTGGSMPKRGGFKTGGKF